LLAIRDGRLYREHYDTFEQYCLQRWQMGRQYAYRLIDAAEVLDNLSPIGDKPATESQARELSRLSPDAQRAAWLVTTESGEPVTAIRVREVVDAAKDVLAAQPDIAPEHLQEAIRKRVAHVAHNSGNHEWYTPEPYTTAARQVMG
jgi:hypothetical protein